MWERISQILLTAEEVGVHIRRGDYKTWKNGQFYFEDAYFVELMKNCVDVFAGKRVRFVIF